MKDRSFVWKRFFDVAAITASCAIYAVAFHFFFQPNHISTGGFTGVSQILNKLVPLFPIGTTTLVLNIPLLAVGVKKQGWRLLVSTLYAIAASSVMIDGLAFLVPTSAGDPLLGALYGGVMLGVSVGILMLKGASTGGTELLARLIKSKFHSLSIGRLCLIIDVMVIAVYALVFQSINNALYSIVAMYICSLAIDMVVYGSANAKMAYIISDRSQEITRHLLQELDLGVTLLEGKGAYTGEHKQVVLCAFKRRQIVPIKAAVTAIDPNAFIIVCEAHEVLGERFGAYSPDGL